MRVGQVIIATGALVVGVGIGSLTRSVQAAYYDRDQLARALADHFRLNEAEVAAFLAAFQYNPAASSTALGGYKYDQYTDQYYPALEVVEVQHRKHLEFIGKALEKEVARGEMTAVVKRQILDKLTQMMNKAPSTEKYLSMNLSQQRAEINKFKAEMDSWLKERGMTLAQLRAITGKGNKFLMGIYY